MCYHDVEVFDDASGQTLYLYNQKNIGQRAYSGHIVPELLKYRGFVAGPSVMVRRDASAGLMHRPDVAVCSDWMFCMEIAARGRVIFLDEPLARYRRHPGNVTNTVEVAYEARVYDLMEQLYPQYRKSAQLGRARMHFLYTFKYLLEKKVARYFSRDRSTTWRVSSTGTAKPTDVELLVRAYTFPPLTYPTIPWIRVRQYWCVT